MTSKKLSKLLCVNCSTTGQVRRIVYGMPSDDFNFEKYAVGGCIIEEDAPDVECQNCGARWNFSN